ncbi:hypothetical protein [Nodularia sp. NIES-3585]|uniref:hypothetical protein n=1 Tax=Nodularia sp. NIES-3585 TaxID=1973477 RepID=UPI000B5C89C8|nr:hypothetical protein [Nodularia sp. NIES-3585]GAX39012.1 hypothetical protein NIES3585_50640 [Nodularia sp. NIES-3585]
MSTTQASTRPTAASPITAYRLTHGYEPAYTKLYWSVAKEVGVNQAVLIQVIESWCSSNAKLKKHGYFHDGEWWTSATYREWESAYPALGSQRSIQRSLLGLEESGYVISCQPKIHKGNAVKFYRVDPVKVGELLLSDSSVVQNLSDANNTNPHSVSMMPKMDDANNTNPHSVSMMPKMDDANNTNPHSVSMMPKMDDANDTHRPIVPKMDGVVPKMDGVVPKMDGVRLESQLQQSFPASNKIKEIKLTQSITGGTEKKAEEKNKAIDQDKAVKGYGYVVNLEAEEESKATDQNEIVEDHGYAVNLEAEEESKATGQNQAVEDHGYVVNLEAEEESKAIDQNQAVEDHGYVVNLEAEEESKAIDQNQAVEDHGYVVNLEAEEESKAIDQNQAVEDHGYAVNLEAEEKNTAINQNQAVENHGYAVNLEAEEESKATDQNEIVEDHGYAVNLEAEEKNTAIDQNQAVEDHRYAVKKEKVFATNEKSTHEGHFSGAARENDSQNLVFSDNPIKEVSFLLYYQTYQRSQGKEINNIAAYVNTVLSKKDEGSTEVFCLFEQWKGVCRTLERKINNFADDPAEKEKQRKRYDFPNWEKWLHEAYYDRLLSQGLAKFCTHKISAKWYEWARVKAPHRFVDIPA